VVAKVEHHQGELFPRVGFIVTNLSLPSRAVVRFYNISNDAGRVKKNLWFVFFFLPAHPCINADAPSSRASDSPQPSVYLIHA